MLGPAAITTHLADLGADVIKVEPPAGRLHPRDDLADRRGRLADAPPHQPGQAQRRARPAHREGRRASSSSWSRGADAVVEAMRPGGLDRRGLGYERLREVNPRIVFCTISRLRHDRSVQGHAEPRHRLRHVGRARRRRGRPRTASPYIPEHPSIGIHAGPLFGALGVLAGIIRARATGEGVQHRDRAVRRRRRDGLAAQRDVEGLRAPGVRGHRQQVRRLRAPRARHRRHAGRRALPVLRDGRRPRPVHGVGAEFWENFCAASTGWTCSSGGPARSTPTTRAATRELQAELREIFATQHVGRVDRVRRTSTTRRSRR